ncbi:MAG TPA: site-2 protease family protein, partial [Anaerohalosphaeraceae bacterium]|nr:site-2 protease family protein [Anaerohalosphaeraceae bacterium]
MTNKQTTSQVAEKGGKNTPQIIVFVLAAAAVVIWGINNPSVALRILAVMLGFGGIVMIHEFGHFIVAKLGGIKVEAFSIGFPPVVVGIRKLKKGWRIRLLPKIGQPQHLEEGDNETEYQIGLIPVGGFVKMLGQSDSGAAEATDDPRSYANRPIWIRIATVAAGVVFNAIGAVIIFIILFMNGINLKPAMVGQVVPNSPAQEAGLRPGDEIIQVDGERFVDFEAVLLAPVLSVPGEPVTFVVREADSGRERKVRIVAEKQAGDSSNLRKMGIAPLTTLTVEPQIARSPELVDEIYKLTGLYPGDQVKAVNGQPVDHPWDFARKVSGIFDSTVRLTIARRWQSADGSEMLVDVDFPMQVGPVVENFRDEFDLAHFSRLVPRLKIEAVMEPTHADTLIRWFQTAILRRPLEPAAWDLLKAGDILLKVADVEYPNYKQLRELTTAYEGKPLPITVLRSGQQGDTLPIEIVVTPKARIGSKRIMIGFAAGLDLDNPVVGQVLSRTDQAEDLPAVPAGAVITAINGRAVENFYQIAAMLQDNAGRSVSIDYQYNGQFGRTNLSVDAYEPVHAQA